MRINKGNILLILLVGLFLGILIVVTVGSKDSEKNQLERRLHAFVTAVPDDVRVPFLQKNDDVAKEKLTQFISQYQSYTNLFSSDDKIKFLKAEYEFIADKEKLKSVPRELMEQWQQYFSVIDFECIPQFSADEVVDYFRKYFVDKLAVIAKK